MSQIEAGLHAHHASSTNSVTHSAATGRALSAVNGSSSDAIGVPFAKVNSIVAGSPASEAGLQIGDRIRQFGNVNWMNHEKLAKVAETVQRNQGVRQENYILGRPMMADNFCTAKHCGENITW